MPEVETGGQVSGNLAPAPSPVTGGGRHLLGDPRKFWGHAREGMRGGAGARKPCSPQWWTLLIPWGEQGLQVEAVDVPSSCPGPRSQQGRKPWLPGGHLSQ